MSLLPIQTDIPFRDISKLVLSNSAFTNPFSSILATTTSTLSDTLSYVTNASTLLNPLYNAGVAANASQISTAITTLTATVSRFTTHTNNISGISLSNGLNGVNFATISTIMSTVHEYRNDGSICELIHGAFGAILKAESIINDINNLLGRLADIRNIPGQIVASVNSLILLLEQQIEDDLNAFASAQIEALQYAASAAINALIRNKCISEVLTRIGSQELKNIVHERINGVFK